jgi:hypothetical protein
VLPSPKRHRVVSSDHTFDIPIPLDQHLRLLERFSLIPVRALPADYLQSGVLIQHIVIPAAADRGIRIRLASDELDVVALFAHQPNELVGAKRGALIVVGDDLSCRHAGQVDLAIDQDAWNPGCLCLLHRRDRGISAGIVEDDCRYLARYRHVIELVLLVRVVVMRVDHDFVTEFPRLFGCSIRFSFEKRIVVRRRDDGNTFRPCGRA